MSFAGLQENLLLQVVYITGSKQTVPAFVGNDYCESGCPVHFQPNLYPDSLWDGERCGSLETVCCQAAGLPWFHKRLSAPASDYIEMRICSNEVVTNEDIPVGYYDIYIK